MNLRALTGSCALPVLLSGLAIGGSAAPATAQCSYEVLAVVIGQPCSFGGRKPIDLRAVNGSLLAVGYESARSNVAIISATWSE